MKADMKRNAEPERKTDNKDLDKPNKCVLSKMESFPEKAVKVNKIKQVNSGYRARAVQGFHRAVAPSTECYFTFSKQLWLSCMES